MRKFKGIQRTIIKISKVTQKLKSLSTIRCLVKSGSGGGFLVGGWGDLFIYTGLPMNQPYFTDSGSRGLIKLKTTTHHYNLNNNYGQSLQLGFLQNGGSCLYLFYFIFLWRRQFPRMNNLVILVNLTFCPFQFVLQQFDNDLSKKLNEMVNEIRSQRCSYLRYVRYSILYDALRERDMCLTLYMCTYWFMKFCLPLQFAVVQKRRSVRLVSSYRFLQVNCDRTC